METGTDNGWQQVLKKLKPQFGDDLDLQAILFIIGLQELGKGPVELSKDQKLDVMHIAICTLLAPYGFYEYEGLDAEGWPHWRASSKLPSLKPGQQAQLMKQAVIDYFTAKEKGRD